MHVCQTSRAGHQHNQHLGTLSLDSEGMGETVPDFLLLGVAGLCSRAILRRGRSPLRNEGSAPDPSQEGWLQGAGWFIGLSVVMGLALTSMSHCGRRGRPGVGRELGRQSPPSQLGFSLNLLPREQ